MKDVIRIKFKMLSYDLDGKKVMQPYEHVVKRNYLEDKVEKMNKLNREQVAKWIIKQAYRSEFIEIVSVED